MDTIENMHGSVVQHGPHNNRIYLMHLDTEKIDFLLPGVDRLAEDKGYTKIFARIPAPIYSRFAEAGYCKEAVVPRFFQGSIDAVFAARYFSAARKKDQPEEQLAELIRNAGHLGPSADKEDNPQPLCGEVRQCTPADTTEMSRIYRHIFASYPFPVDDPSYLKKKMAENVLYFAVQVKGEIAALASAELDPQNSNAEMTDFATVEQWRGRGFAGRLLHHMHDQARRRGITTVYTIARAQSYGMNLVFQRKGYSYGGFLPHNTQIAGSLQSMTVWYKHL
jgi:beta-lysine N6-acetyltransferase